VTSAAWFAVLVGAVAVERLVELVISRRHLAAALARGGVESGRGHFPAMVALHTALLLGAVAEVLLLDRPFVPALGWPALAVALACQAGRYWCIATLGEQWNTRVVVVPGLTAVARGPYRWLRHPNYVVVVVEGIALPLVHGAWVTAAVFTAANAVLLLRYRIPAEERALAALVSPAP
jgi:methyltransferase